MSVRIVHTGEPSGGVIIKCDGIVTGKELVEVNRLVSAKRGQRYQLWDFTDAEQILVTFEEVQALAIQDSTIPEDCELEAVLIVGSSRGIENLAYTYETFSSKWVGRQRKFETVFLADLSDARDWLRNHLGINAVG